MGPNCEELSDDDSDEIQEIQIIPAKSSVPNRGDLASRPHGPVKRRKSSPQMDPIPHYTPTPLHILEQRAKAASTIANHDSPPPEYMPVYEPTPIPPSNYLDQCYSETNRNNNSANCAPSKSLGQATIDNNTTGGSGHHRRNSYNDDYTPLLEPSPSVVGCTTIRHQDELPGIGHRTRQATSNGLRRTGSSAATNSSATISPASRRAAPPPNSSTAFRPVSSAMAQAIARRRNSQITLDSESSTKAASALYNSPALSSSYAEQPVMWSPQLPSQIQPIKVEDNEPDNEPEKYKSPRMTKQRVAHKPTIPQNRSKKPRTPLGVAKKVPMALRVKYLDVIINEYLNTGHPEEQSYQDALKEEQALANRAANKSIYINLVAGLKKRVREKAGISSKVTEDDPKYVNGNKVVSHSEILTGKVTGTFSIERKRKSSDPAELNEYDLYDRLSRYLVPIEELEAYGYPSRDPTNPSLRKIPLGKDGQKQQLRDQLASTYTCERCSKVYRVEPDGMPLSTTTKCIYHPGHLWNERINRNLEKRYSCCKGDPSAGGCSSNPYHVHQGELELANYKGYVETTPKPEREPNKHGIFALDCEMCYTTHGLELTRVTVINHKSEVVYEKLVKPGNPILDYNTKFSGIKEGDLDSVTTSLADVQRDLLDLFSSKAILIGHSLDSDMRALRIFHKRFIDTAQLFPHKRGLPYKRALRTLMVENLRVIIQEDVGHDSKEDASAAFRLVMWKAKTDVPSKAT